MQCSMEHSGSYYYEDFSVDQRFESAPHTTTMEEALRFAQRYDPQAQHLDAEAAKESLFGKLVLSGWETASIAMSQKLASPLGKVAQGLVGIGVESMRWHIPVVPGDTLTTITTITNTRVSSSWPEKGIVQYRVESINQHGKRVLEMQVSVLMPRRPAA